MYARTVRASHAAQIVDLQLMLYMYTRGCYSCVQHASRSRGQIHLTYSLLHDCIYGEKNQFLDSSNQGAALGQNTR